MAGKTRRRSRRVRGTRRFIRVRTYYKRGNRKQNSKGGTIFGNLAEVKQQMFSKATALGTQARAFGTQASALGRQAIAQARGVLGTKANALGTQQANALGTQQANALGT